MKTSFSRFKKHWLAFFLALGGIVFSLLLWHSTLLQAKTQTHYLSDVLEASLPWFILFLGVVISLLIAIAIVALQLARHRAVILDKTHENLKNEVAERIQTEETKKTLEKALLHGQKLQAVGTLAGGIAHDFNNLLYAIKGYIEITRQDVPQDSIAYKNLGKVLEAAHRGEELISRILAFSRRHHPELRSIELNTTLEAVLDLLRPTVPASVIIHFEHSDPLYTLANQTQIHQVVVNIINNAVDSMEGEGHITMRAVRLLASDPLLHQFPQIPIQNYCKIDIMDTGRGMDPQTMERIFEPFFTTKEVGKGTGLGLSIVHTIIKEHHGEVSVSSHIGHGTTFTLLLPEHLPHKEGE